MAWIVYHLAPRLGYKAVLWEIPLEVIYSLEHVHLWEEGKNTQGRIKADDAHEKIKTIAEKYDAKHL